MTPQPFGTIQQVHISYKYYIAPFIKFLSRNNKLDILYKVEITTKLFSSTQQLHP
ncbi:hypothetical protein SAMN04488018_1411 [Myroides marinus]|uniref:Uncharacterized protein n=1 Tax=Myroides marinus TaxID=703342 RepID=A0A1H6YNI7_9FLAO|nr:hypothetical protein SAMN04488018_1411 [Myroides marinus]